ncbi:unnamed protein product [Lupinus luteus]|uniref:Uncharacterized protein n=1 Tax=Lupinus luteus TaxID=3873 RepID=A0AAV1WB85_LUPLU
MKINMLGFFRVHDRGDNVDREGSKKCRVLTYDLTIKRSAYGLRAIHNMRVQWEPPLQREY